MTFFGKKLGPFTPPSVFLLFILNLTSTNTMCWPQFLCVRYSANITGTLGIATHSKGSAIHHHFQKEAKVIAACFLRATETCICQLDMASSES